MYRKKKKFPLIILVSSIILVIGIAVVIFLISYNNSKKPNDSDLSYTQTLNMDANLVVIEGYYVGQGDLDGVTHYIFQVEKDGQKSTDIDVSDMHAKLIYVDETTDNKDKIGKVLAYDRTYSDNTKHFYYELYVNKDMVKDLGDLSLDSPDDTETDTNE